MRRIRTFHPADAGFVFAIGFMLLFAIGCAQGKSGPRRPAMSGFSEVDRAAAARDAAPARAPAPPRPVKLASFKDGEGKGPGERRIVIYNAGYRIVVQEIEVAIRQTEALAEELGGYVQSIETDTIRIRVPVASFKVATNRVEQLGRVSHHDLEAEDVTEEYVDLEARLKSAMAVRDRLKGLLEKAEDVKSALEVEKELARVGEEIERLQGKLELIKSRVAFSTITVVFERVSRTTPAPQLFQLPFAWLRDLDPSRLTRTY